jgi:hypothetical protein
MKVSDRTKEMTSTQRVSLAVIVGIERLYLDVG